MVGNFFYLNSGQINYAFLNNFLRIGDKTIYKRLYTVMLYLVYWLIYRLLYKYHLIFEYASHRNIPLRPRKQSFFNASLLISGHQTKLKHYRHLWMVRFIFIFPHLVEKIQIYQELYWDYKSILNWIHIYTLIILWETSPQFDNLLYVELFHLNYKEIKSLNLPDRFH